MLNLAEYKRTSTCLSDYLPWACLVAPGIVLNKDGSYQRTFRYRGPDLDSATAAELVSVSARLNNIVKRFGDGRALFFEAARVPAGRYPAARFADAASWLVDQERRNDFLAEPWPSSAPRFATARPRNRSRLTRRPRRNGTSASDRPGSRRTIGG